MQCYVYLRLLRFSVEFLNLSMFTLPMEINLNDIVPKPASEEKKESTTFAVRLSKRELEVVEQAKRLLGRNNVAEIVRRSLSAGLTAAIEKFGNKAS